MNNILLVKCVHIQKNKTTCVGVISASVQGDGSLLNVKLSDLKKKKHVYYYFTFHGYIEVVT